MRNGDCLSNMVALEFLICRVLHFSRRSRCGLRENHLKMRNFPTSTLKSSHLLALPLEPFRFYQYGQRVVHLDGCVEVEASYYSAPPGWIGRQVQVLVGKHGGYLSLGSAVNASVGPVCFPAIQISLGLFQAFKPLSFEWGPLGMAHAGFHFAFVESHQIQIV